MRWLPGGRSDDIEDRRDESGGGGGGGFITGPRLGLGGTAIVLVLSLVFRQNFFAVLGGGQSSPSPVSPSGPSAPRPHTADEEKLVQFVSFVIDDVQHTWERELPKASPNHPYRHAKLVLFTDRVRSGCGFAEAAMGPFYCPGDEKVYIDLGFYRELKTRFGAPGEFAEAYVIAHEVGHHVQKLLGIEARMRSEQHARPDLVNRLSVRLELQADCFAGVWGHSTKERNILDPGDVDDGLRAAAAVGDDRLQRSATGAVHPEKWTHGSSQQRMAWFKRGYESGRVDACDTFAAQP